MRVLRQRRIRRLTTRFKSPYFLIAFILITALIGWGADKTLPHQDLPWRSLNPDRPLGFATKLQLMRLSLAPSQSCMDMADHTQRLTSTPADPHRPNKSCGWDVARNVSHSAGIWLAPDPVNMQCPLSIASYLWSRELTKLALEEFDSPVASITHYGTYSCRKQNGNNSGAWSEHAFANAWDVAGFKLKDGRVISVKSGWNGTRNERRFLRRARKQACKIFNVTLSPDFNAAHADHFHFDMGPNRSCR